MDLPFTAAPHGDVLALILQLTILLASARLLGELAQRLRQPAVVGEILAGVLLGPSTLGALLPGLARTILPANPVQGHLLEAVAMLGAMLLLAVTGLETDLGLIRRRAGTAVGVAAGGLVVPFAAGLALGWGFPADLLGETARRPVFALFLATALAISAIPVLATILLELRMMRRDVGQTMLAAGMVDDLAGWTLLGVVVSLAGDRFGAAAVASTLLTVVVFLAVTALLGPALVHRLVRLVHGGMRSRERLLTLSVVLIFAWGAFTQALHLEPVVGAFAMGVLLGRVRRLPTSVHHSLESMAIGVFAPIFFAVAGLKVDLRTITSPRLAALTLLLVAVAVAGKVGGAYLGARHLARTDRWTALSYGIGLTARGAIGIVVATVGLSLGILTPEVFSMIVVMAVVTSVLTPPVLSWSLRRIPAEEQELKRLQREEATSSGLLSHLRQVLVPVRPRPEPSDALQVKAVVLGRLAQQHELAVTVLTSAPREARGAAELTARQVVARLGRGLDVGWKVAAGADPVTGVLEEAARGYDLIVLGATELAATSEVFFSPVVDEVVRLAPCPTLVLRGGTDDPEWVPRRILVPTDGTRASERAAELAFAVAGHEAVVTLLHVVVKEKSPVLAMLDTGPVDRLDLGHQLTGQLRGRGEALGVQVEAMVEVGPEPEVVILDVAGRIGADLLVLGTAVRPGTQRLHLGPRVEQAIAACPCPVAVLNT